jgi:hypothetical protein
MARKLGLNDPESVSLTSVAQESRLLLAEAALVEAEPSFLNSKFSQACAFVEKAAELLKRDICRDAGHAEGEALSFQEQLKKSAASDAFSAGPASSDQLWKLVRMSCLIAFSADRDPLMRLLASFLTLPTTSAATLGLAKQDIELLALSLLHVASFNGSFKDGNRSRAGMLSRLTFISEAGASALDYTGQIFFDSLTFSLHVLAKIPYSLQLLDNLFWIVLAYFPFEMPQNCNTKLSDIIATHFNEEERSCVLDSESSASSPERVIPAAVLQLLGTHYKTLGDNMYRFFSNFWSVVFCILNGAFVTKNLLCAISAFEADAKASAPSFICRALHRLRLILQPSCDRHQIGYPNENLASQLTFDDSDFESIPLHLQVGLLACRGMIILHDGLAYGSQVSDDDSIDKAALHFFDRAEQVSRLVVPRTVRVYILFAKAFVSFRRSYFFAQAEVASLEESSGGSTSTRPADASLLAQQMLCFNEGLKYLKSLCKCVFIHHSASLLSHCAAPNLSQYNFLCRLLHIDLPWNDKSVSRLGICDYSILDLVAPNSSAWQSCRALTRPKLQTLLYTDGSRCACCRGTTCISTPYWLLKMHLIPANQLMLRLPMFFVVVFLSEAS